MDKFKTETCLRCGIMFCVPQQYQAERIKDHEGFCCPNGHILHYTPKPTEVDKLRKELGKCQEACRASIQFRGTLVRSRAAFRGQITKLKKKLQEK